VKLLLESIFIVDMKEFSAEQSGQYLGHIKKRHRTGEERKYEREK
jgi:hypothetical protein